MVRDFPAPPPLAFNRCKPYFSLIIHMVRDICTPPSPSTDATIVCDVKGLSLSLSIISLIEFRLVFHFSAALLKL